MESQEQIPDPESSPVQDGEPLSLIFTAISSKVILSQCVYNITLFVDKADEKKKEKKPTSAALYFSAKITREEETISSLKEISVPQGKTATLSIQIPELKSPPEAGTDYSDKPQHEYKLILTARDETTEKKFEGKIYRLTKNKFQIPLLAHTDKGVYKPGDTVKFRIVVLDQNFRPFPNSDSDSDSKVKLNVKIFDPDQNLVKMWTEAQTRYGMFSSEFPVSTNPILGGWRIEYEALVKTFQKSSQNPNEQEHKENGTLSFSVEKYVLPKYKMSLQLPPRIMYTDEKISVRVEVKYTHGGGVKGQVKLTPSFDYVMSDENPNPNPHPNSDPTLEKLVPIDDSGVLQAEIEYKNLFGLGKFRDLYETTIYVHVEFTDGVTGKTTKGSDSVHLYEHPYKIETWSKPSQLVKGLDYTLFIKPTMLDGSPIATASKDKFRDFVLVMHPFSFPSSGNAKEQRKKSGGKENHKENGEQKCSIHSKIPVLKLDSDGIAKINFDSSVTSRANQQNNRLILLRFRDLTEMHLISYYDIRHSASSNLHILIKDQDDEENPNARNPTPIVKTAADKTGQIQGSVTYSRPFQSINYFIADTETETKEILSSGAQDFPSLEKIQHFKIPCPKENPNPNPNPNSSTLASLAEKQLSLFIFTVVDAMVTGKSDFLLKNSNPDSNSKQNPNPNQNSKDANFLDISLSEETREPAQNVMLKIHTGKNSLVALKAVDESVLLLKNNGDIDDSAIASAKRTRDFHDNYVYIPWESNVSPSLDLMNSNRMRVLTNGPLKERPRYADQKMGRAYGPGGSPIYVSPSARIRTEFPETWIWEETFSSDGILNLSKIVPDSLTSWIITGFSISQELGIAALSTPKKLRVDREFFLVLELPYSVIQGETLHLQVIIHNHNHEKKEILAEITLENPEGTFEFESDAQEQEKSSKLKSMVKKITVKPDSTSFVTFPIKPVKFGVIDLKVTGSAETVFVQSASNGRKRSKGSSGSNELKWPSGSNVSNYSDALSQQLRVVPPGERQSQSVAVLLTPADKNIQLAPLFPESSVRLEDSLKISAISDLLGATIENMDKLIQMPCGCGEQNMLNFVVDIVVLEYLESSSSSKNGENKVREKAIEFLESGYQRQLIYRHKRDGSFSCFGPTDSDGSTWLTAFVLRSFLKASTFIKIDDQVNIKAAEFLLEQQDEKSGNFEEKGTVHDSRLMGNSGPKGVALTAFCLLALLDAKETLKSDSDSYSKSIQNGLNFILRETKPNNAENETDLYALILTTYALHLANHEEKDKHFQVMEKAARKQGDLIFWGSSGPEKEEAANSKMKPVWIEMTGYALLIYMLREGNSNYEPSSNSKTLQIVKWLLKHRNSSGGFISTQDTVVGLSAIAQFAKGTKSKDGAAVDLNIVAKHGEGGKEEVKITVNEKNSIILQEFILSPSTPSVSLTASGRGSALVQLSWYYFLQNPEKQPAFSLDVTALEQPGNAIALKICTSFILAGKESESESNMAIVEVNFPSGFSVDKEMLSSLEKVSNYKRHETENQDNRINIYFETLSKTPTCFELEAQQMFKVVNPAKTYVSVFDYYDPTRRARNFYTLTKTLNAQQPSSKPIEKSEETNKINVSISPPPSKNRHKNPPNNNKNKNSLQNHRNKK